MRVINRVTLAAAASVAAQRHRRRRGGGRTVAQARLIRSWAASARSRRSPQPCQGNGDVNPYGVAVVRHSQGKLVQGNVLVSNFNNSRQPAGHRDDDRLGLAERHQASVFAQISAAHLPGACPGGIGLTTALSILHGGWVVVGSLPTTGGDPATSKAGCLLVLNSQGKVVETFAGHGINGPWDMTAVNFGPVAELFVTNVLNGTVGGQLQEAGHAGKQGDGAAAPGHNPAARHAQAARVHRDRVWVRRADRPRRPGHRADRRRARPRTGRSTSRTRSATGSPPSRTRCSAAAARGPDTTVSRRRA